MAFLIKSEVGTVKKVASPQPRSIKPPYEIPERYRNSFYLANAAFFDSTNWFLHRAYEVIFPTLKEKFKLVEPNITNNDEVAEKLEGIVNVLDHCNSVIDVRFPIKKDNGFYEIVRGFRAHHGLATGYKSCLGGLRIDQNITRDHMKALSVISTYRNACMGINMAGAHGGIKINPGNYSENELRSIVENYTLEMIKKGYCYESDIYQPDINSSEQEMSWISKVFMKHTGLPSYLAAAGKLPEDRGLNNYRKMSSLGGFVALDFFLNIEQFMQGIGLTMGLKEKTFIIQGLGKLGSALAELLVSKGAICVGVKDQDAYIYDAKGIDLQKLYEHKEKTGSIKSYQTAKDETNDNIYSEQCDILIFAAHQKSLNCYAANNVKAKIIVEAADGPITPTAHQILISRQKLVIPDIFACSGGTITSYLEYLWNLQQLGVFSDDALKFSNGIYEKTLSLATKNETYQHMDEAVLTVLLQCVINSVGSEIINLVHLHQLNTDVRCAAYMVGISNIFNVLFREKKFL